jgi:hypothetical protein
VTHVQWTALALALISGTGALASDDGALELSEALVFPRGEAATSARLDVPLSQILPGGRPPAPGALALVVHKAKRRLDLLVDGRLVKSYLVNLGLSPLGDKERRGDNRTPEGDLFVCAKNPKSQFTRFLALAYPSPDHVLRAVVRRGVDGSLGRAVRAAYRRRRSCPPQESALGGAVGIHGRGGWTRTANGFHVTDWTWGCLGLRDADILELFDLVSVGTRVRILAE